MKELVSIGLAIVIFMTYNQQEKRYTQQSAEIDTYKKVLVAYEERDWESMVSHYADTAKIMNNVLEEDAQNLSQFLTQTKEDAAQFSSWDFMDTESEYEMVVTDDGETWVNFWGVWKGTFKANNKEYKIPTHSTAQFVNGKIVKEAGYWDVSKIIQDMHLAKNDVSDSVEKASEN